jgi:hypothetical protein
MKQGQVTPKQFDRFASIAAFEKRTGRMPVNVEVCRMFNLKSLSSSFLTLKRYAEWKKGRTNKPITNQ